MEADCLDLRRPASDEWWREENAMEMTTNRPRYNPLHDEWSLRTGPSTWLVWKHGTRPDDEERLRAELAAELANEQRSPHDGAEPASES
jgi:hypothetical protein